MSYDRADYDYSTEARASSRQAMPQLISACSWPGLPSIGCSTIITNSIRPSSYPNCAARQLTGRQFFQAACQEQLAEKDLNVEGNFR